MAGRVLAHVQAYQEQAEGGGAAQAVEQRAIGDHAHAAGVQRLVAQLQRLDQVAVVLQDALRGRHLAGQGLVGPVAGHAQALAQLLEQGAIGLGAIADPRQQLRRGLLHGQLGGQSVDIAQVQVGGHPARQQQDLAGHAGGDVGIAVAVAPHPGREAQRRGGQRQAFAGAAQEYLVDVPKDVRQGLPERMFDHREAPFRLVHRGRPDLADLVGMPGLGHQPLQALLDATALLRQQVGMVLGRQLRGDRIVFLDQRAPRHLGGMGGQHQFDLQPGELASQLPGGMPGVLETPQQLFQHQVLEGFRLVRPAPADTVVLLGDIGQVEELVEGPRHRQQFVFLEPVEGGGELLGALRGTAAGSLGALADQLDLVEEPRAVLLADGVAEQFAQLVDVLAQARIDLRHDLSPLRVGNQLGSGAPALTSPQGASTAPPGRKRGCRRRSGLV